MIATTETPQHPSSLRNAANAKYIRLALRFALSGTLASLGVLAVWRRIPRPLMTSTDVVGYPIFADFNFTRYFDAYYLIALAFPAVMLVIYSLLAWRGPLRSPPRQRPIRPVTTCDSDRPSHTRASASGRTSSPYALLSLVGRIGLPAATVALEVSAARGAGRSVPTLSGVIAGAVYFVVVLGLTGFVNRRRVARHTSGAAEHRLSPPAAILRAGTGLCVVPLLLLVSRASSVTVESDHRVVHYPWLPLWLVALATALLITWFVYCARRPTARNDPARLEGTVLTFLVAPTALFVCFMWLPGAFGPFMGIDDGPGLASAQLTFHGFFPWKDLLFIHGMLVDVFDNAFGMAVFGDSRWGAYSGTAMFVTPLTITLFYLLAAYVAGRNRLIAVGFWLALLTGVIAPLDNRFALLPVILILFDAMLRRPSRVRSAAFITVLFFAAIITPEIGLLVPGTLATLVAFEWLCRQPNGPIWRGFRRTKDCLLGASVLTVLWVVFLAACGALSGFIAYYRVFGPGHAASGAFPAQWSLEHHPAVTFEFFLPVVLVLLTMWRVVAKLRGRRPWMVRDWTMVAAATWALTYYPKALGRADIGHVEEVFTVAVPLVVLWVVEVLRVGERLLRHVVDRLRGMRRLMPRHALTVLAVIMVLVFAPTTPGGLRYDVLRVQPVVESEPTIPRMGYAIPAAVDPTTLQDLQAVLDRYAGPDGTVFDFTNDPGIVYYLLGREPATRFFMVSMAVPSYAQTLLISDLERSRPRVVVFDDTTNGASEWDGILNIVRHYEVSQYLLDHYVPLVDVDGKLIMIRSDLAHRAPSLPPIRGDYTTSDLYFDVAQCAWGDIPNFLRVPDEPAPSSGIPVPTHVVSGGVVTGWAVDPADGRPALQVVAVRNGHVVASTIPATARPDVAAALHSGQALRSGFTVALPAGPGPVELYSLNVDGSMTPLAVGPGIDPASVAMGRASSVVASDGVTHRVSRQSGNGLVEAYSGRQQIISLTVPDGGAPSSYRWMGFEVSGDYAGSVTLTDASGLASHDITFSVLHDRPRLVGVEVASCPQWHGYSGSSLFLTTTGSAAGTNPVLRVWLTH